MSVAYTEIFNVENLKIVLKNKKYFMSLMRSESFEQSDYCPFTLCEKYLAKSKNGVVEVKYFQNNDKGRLFAVDSLSLQCIPREIRATIANDLYYDIDMVNAHPILVEYIARVHLDYKCEFLNDYIYNRENKIQNVLDVNPDMTRDNVKELILSVMYGGNSKYSELKNRTKWLESFYEEMHTIFNKLKENYPKKLEKLAKIKKFNVEGSLLSSLACEYENQLLQIMVEYFTNKRIIKKTAVLCFDGLLIPKGKLTEDKLKTHLAAIETIFKSRGFEMKLAVKPMKPLPLTNIPILDEEDDDIESSADAVSDSDCDYEVTDDDHELDWYKLYEQGLKVETLDAFNKFSQYVKSIMDLHYTMISHSSNNIIIAHTYENDCICDGLVVRKKRRHYMTLNSFKIYLDNKLIYTNYRPVAREPAEFINPFTLWYRCRDRNEKAYIEFDPLGYFQKTGHRIYNLFDGYRITHDMCRDSEPLTIDDPILNHLYKRWAHCDMEVYNFIMGWFAMTVQKPHVKLNSCLVVRGKEGAGKGTPIMLLRSILGHKYVSQPSSPNSVLGDFNSSLEGVKLLFLDELVWGGDKQRAGVLKKLATEDTLEINRKHLPAYTVRNLLNICMSSNEDWVVPAGLTARRFMVCNIDNELAGVNLTADKKRVLLDIVNTDILRFAKTLYEWDVSQFNDRSCPQTDALRQQKILSFGPIDSYWHDCLANGYVVANGRNYEFGTEVPKEEMFAEFSANNRFVSKVQFWVALHKLSGSESFRRRRDNRWVYSIKLPSLEAARDAFRTHISDPNWNFMPIAEIEEEVE